MCKACHAEERAAFRSTFCSAPLPQLRKINCIPQIAVAENPLKKLRGELRGEKRALHLKS